MLTSSWSASASGGAVGVFGRRAGLLDAILRAWGGVAAGEAARAMLDEREGERGVRVAGVGGVYSRMGMTQQCARADGCLRP